MRLLTFSKDSEVTENGNEKVGIIRSIRNDVHFMLSEMPFIKIQMAAVLNGE